MARITCACGELFDGPSAVKRVAKAYGTKARCPACIDRHNNTPGIETQMLRTGRLVPADEVIARVYRDSDSLRDTAKVLGVSVRTVVTAMARLGLATQWSVWKEKDRASKADRRRYNAIWANVV